MSELHCTLANDDPCHFAILFDRSQGRVVYLLHTNIQKSCKKRCVNNEDSIEKQLMNIPMKPHVIIFVRVSGSLRFF